MTSPSNGDVDTLLMVIREMLDEQRAEISRDIARLLQAHRMEDMTFLELVDYARRKRATRRALTLAQDNIRRLPGEGDVNFASRVVVQMAKGMRR